MSWVQAGWVGELCDAWSMMLGSEMLVCSYVVLPGSASLMQLTVGPFICCCNSMGHHQAGGEVLG